MRGSQSLTADHNALLRLCSLSCTQLFSATDVRRKSEVIVALSSALQPRGYFAIHFPWRPNQFQTSPRNSMVHCHSHPRSYSSEASHLERAKLWLNRAGTYPVDIYIRLQRKFTDELLRIITYVSYLISMFSVYSLSVSDHMQVNGGH